MTSPFQYIKGLRILRQEQSRGDYHQKASDSPTHSPPLEIYLWLQHSQQH